MNPEGKKHEIQSSIKSFSQGALVENALNLLSSLGYKSERRFADLELSPENIAELFPSEQTFREDKALLYDWKSVHFLFQLSGDEITDISQGRLEFTETTSFDPAIYQSYLFFAIELIGESYTRTQLSQITREINKLFLIPVMVLFKHRNTLTQAIINRRPHKRDEHKDVLEKVTLIKDISIHKPHRAHIEILFDLSLEEIERKHSIRNFLDLHNAWQGALDASELNKRFFKELANWYFWTIQNVTFPEGVGEDEENRNATSVIRLITRMIFLWFIKEKGIVPDILFDDRRLKEILYYVDYNDSTYYKSILQNLFFATLNQEMNTPKKPDNRKFRGKTSKTGGRDQHYLIHNVYRYQNYFINPDQVLSIFESIPFLNGGLFECLDHLDKDDPTKIIRIDGFSDRYDNPLRVPDYLFFGEAIDIDLNEVYGTKNKPYKVCGLIHTLNRYKFTVEENTPIEEEVALDPELLGRVFENLLAAYNPETGTTARKQTGSFYTPREIVDYMVNESLINHFKTEFLSKNSSLKVTEQSLEERFRDLFEYNDSSHQFTPNEVKDLITAIDDLKVLDPAVGSGAFPMGVLHKLVYVLSKLDPGNVKWKETQINKVIEIPDITVRQSILEDIEENFSSNELDYGRKLYLIENCIYGVDIQPIAVQIAKLRFFISLVVDQRITNRSQNRGIRPLPNLETKFIAGNSLIGIDNPQIFMRNPQIIKKEKELVELRKKYFSARKLQSKRKYQLMDNDLRSEIGILLENEGFPSGTTQLIISWDPYDQNTSSNFFDPSWMFGFNDGFDIIIGNPPYLGERGNKEIFRKVRWSSSFGKKYYKRKMDLFYFFFHLALDISKRDGVIAFISTNYYPTADGAILLRTDLKKRAVINQIINFNELKIFESAPGQHNMITIFKKDFNEIVVARISISTSVTVSGTQKLKDMLEWIDKSSEYYEIPQRNLYGGEDNIFSYDSVPGLNNSMRLKQELLEKIQSSGTALGLICKINMGVQSGADLVGKSLLERALSKNFVDDEYLKENDIALGDEIYIINQEDLNIFESYEIKDIVKPFVKNSDIKKFFVSEETNKFYLYVDSYIDIEKYPNVKSHLLKFRPLLKAREQVDDSDDKWFRIRGSKRKFIIGTGEHIICPYRAKQNIFALTDGNIIGAGDVYYITKIDRSFPFSYLLGLLNSKLMYFWLYHKGKRKGETLELYKTPLSKIPIIIPSSEKDVSDIIKLTNRIVEQKRQNENARTRNLENTIDEMIYHLYGLSKDEKKFLNDQ